MRNSWSSAHMFRASRRMRRATKWSPMDGRGATHRLLWAARARPPGPQRAGIAHGNPVYRGVRQFDLTLRNSLVRDNVAWQAYGASRLLWKMTHHQPGSPLPADSLLPTSDRESEPHLAVANEFSPAQSEASRHRTAFRKWPSLWMVENLSACTSEISIWLLSIPRLA